MSKKISMWFYDSMLKNSDFDKFSDGVKPENFLNLINAQELVGKFVEGYDEDDELVMGGGREFVSYPFKFFRDPQENHGCDIFYDDNRRELSSFMSNKNSEFAVVMDVTKALVDVESCMDVYKADGQYENQIRELEENPFWDVDKLELSFKSNFRGELICAYKVELELYESKSAYEHQEILSALGAGAPEKKTRARL